MKGYKRLDDRAIVADLIIQSVAMRFKVFSWSITQEGETRAHPNMNKDMNRSQNQKAAENVHNSSPPYMTSVRLTPLTSTSDPAFSPLSPSFLPTGHQF